MLFSPIIEPFSLEILMQNTRVGTQGEAMPPVIFLAIGRVFTVNELSSDHNPVIFDFVTNCQLPCLLQTLKTTNWIKFQEILHYNMPGNPTVDNLDQAVQNFSNIVSDEFTEVVVGTHSHASQPIENARRNFTPSHINQLIKHKNNLRKHYQQTLNPFYKTLYNRAQANLKKELKIYTWNARLEALNTSDNSLWEAQRFLKNKRSQIPTLNCATGRPRQTSRREDHHIIRNARVQPTASSAAIQAQVAPSLGAPVSSRTVRRRLAERHLGSRRPLRMLPLTLIHRRLRLEWCYGMEPGRL
ncbi:transposable element Tcb2 transposase [Trichonephila clavipes]|nr:transposable element Tcb2 transposase [Trichonephila clavipes]